MAWDGSASNWSTPESYCSDCLIDLNESGQPKTKDKCKLPIRAEGESGTNREALIAAASGHGVTQVDAPPEVKRRAANRIISLYPRVVGTQAPDSVYRVAGKKPPMSKSLIFKGKDSHWFLGYYSNNFLDRHGEIISEAAHKEYIEWLNKTGIKPPVILAHQPQYPTGVHLVHYLNLVSGKISAQEFNENLRKIYKATAFAITEKVIYLNGFTLVLAKVLDDKLHMAKAIQNSPVEWGMSHGFLSLDNNDNIIEKYRAFEFSALPVRLAANINTGVSFKEIHSMDNLRDKLKALLNEEDREAVEDVLSTVEIDELEQGSADAQKILAGSLPSKEDGQNNDLVGAVLKALDIEGLQATLKAMSDKIVSLEEQLKVTDAKLAEKQAEVDDLVADVITPGWGEIMDKMFMDGPDDDQIIEEMKQNVPQINKEKSDNMMDVGLWQFFGGSAN